MTYLAWCLDQYDEIAKADVDSSPPLLEEKVAQGPFQCPLQREAHYHECPIEQGAP